MEAREITIVTFASPAALRAEGTVKDTGQIRHALTLWKYRTLRAVYAVMSDRLYAQSTRGITHSTMRLTIHMHR